MSPGYWMIDHIEWKKEKKNGKVFNSVVDNEKAISKSRNRSVIIVSTG